MEGLEGCVHRLFVGILIIVFVGIAGRLGYEAFNISKLNNNQKILLEKQEITIIELNARLEECRGKKQDAYVLE